MKTGKAPKDVDLANVWRLYRMFIDRTEEWNKLKGDKGFKLATDMIEGNTKQYSCCGLRAT